MNPKVVTGQWRKHPHDPDAPRNWRFVAGKVPNLTGQWRVQYHTGATGLLDELYLEGMTLVTYSNPWEQKEEEKPTASEAVAGLGIPMLQVIHDEVQEAKDEIEVGSAWRWKFSQTMREVLMVTDDSVFYRQTYTDPSKRPGEPEGRFSREQWLDLHVPTAPPGERWSVDHGEHQYVDWFGDILHISTVDDGSGYAIATSRAGGDERVYVDIPLDELIEKLNEIRNSGT